MLGAGIHFDFCLHARFAERLFHDCLVIGTRHVVICRNRDEELRLGLRGHKMWAGVTIAYQSRAVE